MAEQTETIRTKIITELVTEGGQKSTRDVLATSKALQNAETSADRARKKFKGFSLSLGSARDGVRALAAPAMKAAKGVLAIVAALAAVSTALVAFGIQQGRIIQQLGDTSDKLGLSAEALQSYRLAANQAGVNTATLDTAIQRMARRVADFVSSGGGELAGVIDKYNIAVTDAQGATLSTEQVFQNVLGTINEIADSGERLRVAFRFFDSEGAGLVNLARQADSLEEFNRTLRDSGFILENQFVKRTADASAELDFFGNVISNVFSRAGGAITQFVADSARGLFETVIPLLNTIIDKVAIFTGILSAARKPTLLEEIQRINGEIAKQEKIVQGISSFRERNQARLRIFDLQSELAPLQKEIELRDEIEKQLNRKKSINVTVTPENTVKEITKELESDIKALESFAENRKIRFFEGMGVGDFSYLNDATKFLEKLQGSIGKIKTEDAEKLVERFQSLKSLTDRYQASDTLINVKGQVESLEDSVSKLGKTQAEVANIDAQKLIDKLKALGKSDLPLVNVAIASYISKLKEANAAQQAFYAEQERLQTPLNSFVEANKKLGDALETSVVSGITSVEDAFVSLIDGTKTVADAFRDLVKNIIGDIARLVIRQAVTVPLLQSLGFGATASAVGGMIDGAGAIQRFAAGGHVRDRVPALLEPGEFVMRRPAVKAIGEGNLERMNATGRPSGDFKNEIRIINQTGRELDGQIEQPRFELGKAVTDVILTDARNNGPIRQTLRKQM